jgi:hypothetical protein
VLNGGSMRTMLYLLASSFAACTTQPPMDNDATPQPEPQGTCDAPVGKLTLYAIPPPAPLDWSTPNNLLASVLTSSSAGSALVAAGDAVMTHEIGHVNLELDCGDDSIPLTGQTGGGEDWQAATDGAGLLLRDTPGAMDAMTGVGDPVETANDIAARERSGNVTRISFVVNRNMCVRIKTFVDAYVASGAWSNYDGASRPRRMEGAGCAIFGAGVVDVGGLLRRSVFTPVWARTEMIGNARISDFLGSGSYRYGGNLVARAPDGTDWIWPRGQSVPASNTTPVYIDSAVLDAWSGPEDQPFGVPGAVGEMTSKLPFTIYDPELMSEWGEQIYAAAVASGNASSLGATWTAGTVAAAHEVTFDAHCVQPQTLAFDADNDDLFADSDAPNE